MSLCHLGMQEPFLSLSLILGLLQARQCIANQRFSKHMSLVCNVFWEVLSCVLLKFCLCLNVLLREALTVPARTINEKNCG